MDIPVTICNIVVILDLPSMPAIVARMENLIYFGDTAGETELNEAYELFGELLEEQLEEHEMKYLDAKLDQLTFGDWFSNKVVEFENGSITMSWEVRD